MGARRTVLPITKRRFPDTIGRSAQVRSGTGIEVGASHTIARHARSIAEIIEICLANGLFRSAERINADVGAGTGLPEGHSGDQEKKKEKEWHRRPPGCTFSLVPAWQRVKRQTIVPTCDTPVTSSATPTSDTTSTSFL